MQARFYDPTSGRFLSKDTIVPDPNNPQALNRYPYVIGNPMLYTDPTGHCVLCRPGQIESGWYLVVDGVEQVGSTLGDAAVATGGAIGNTVADDALDTKLYAQSLWNHPGSAGQNTLTYAIAITSVGDRRDQGDGFATYFDCKGSCSVVNQVLLTPDAYTPGYTAFSSLDELSPTTIIHERQHYIQSNYLGPQYYLFLGWEMSTAGYKNSLFKRDAERAELRGRNHEPPDLGPWRPFRLKPWFPTEFLRPRVDHWYPAPRCVLWC